MPYKIKLDKIKKDPKKWAHYKAYNRKWIKQRRVKRVFLTMIERVQTASKSKGLPVSIKPFDLWRLAKRQKLICPLTGRKLNRQTISLDHIVPTSKGGTNKISNLRLVHLDANMAKQNLLENDFLSLCADIVKFHKLL